MMSAGKALMKAPLVKPLVTAMGGQYGGKSGVSATLGLSLLPNGRISRQLDDRQDFQFVWRQIPRLRLVEQLKCSFLIGDAPHSSGSFACRRRQL
jgi:hypothetical protein